jgi:hypothetical protein
LTVYFTETKFRLLRNEKSGENGIEIPALFCAVLFGVGVSIFSFKLSPFSDTYLGRNPNKSL